MNKDSIIFDLNYHKMTIPKSIIPQYVIGQQSGV